MPRAASSRSLLRRRGAGTARPLVQPETTLALISSSRVPCASATVKPERISSRTPRAHRSGSALAYSALMCAASYKEEAASFGAISPRMSHRPDEWETDVHTLVVFEFPFEGPWGQGLEAAMGELAADIAREERLAWKLWTEAPERGTAGGVYLF